MPSRYLDVVFTAGFVAVLFEDVVVLFVAVDVDVFVVLVVLLEFLDVVDFGFVEVDELLELDCVLALVVDFDGALVLPDCPLVDCAFFAVLFVVPFDVADAAFVPVAVDLLVAEPDDGVVDADANAVCDDPEIEYPEA